MKFSRLVGPTWLGLSLLLAGCVPGMVEVQVEAPQPTPTIHALFSGDYAKRPDATGIEAPPQLQPTVAAFFRQAEPPTPRPTSTPVPTLALPTPATSDLDYVAVDVYADELDPNWLALQDPDMDVDLSNRDVVRSGDSAIAMTPQKDFARLFFAVSPETEMAYPRDRVIGLSLWLNGGESIIETSDLAVAVVGSNQLPFWSADDRSVDQGLPDAFSETRLYYLGVNRSIPPDTWVRVEVLLDDLQYDPLYQYVTGFYIKNDAGFRQTVYVDDVSLMLSPGDAADLVPPASGLLTPIESTPAPAPPEPDEALPEPTDEPPVEPTATAETAIETSCVVSPPEGWRQHTVVEGDTVSHLAFEANTDMRDFMRINCLTSTVLRIGRELWISAPEATETPIPSTKTPSPSDEE